MILLLIAVVPFTLAQPRQHRHVDATTETNDVRPSGVSAQSHWNQESRHELMQPNAAVSKTHSSIHRSSALHELSNDDEDRLRRNVKSRRRQKYRRICHFAPIQCLLGKQRRPQSAYHPAVLAAANDPSVQKVTGTVSTETNFAGAWLRLGHRVSKDGEN
ncbi:hypothetical protein AAVH_05871 [Aphelenchoides avenae]|nr:hypothetical protein AAVH_05871 [Aphelenchus avenae]